MVPASMLGSLCMPVWVLTAWIAYREQFRQWKQHTGPRKFLTSVYRDATNQWRLAERSSAQTINTFTVKPISAPTGLPARQVR